MKRYMIWTAVAAASILGGMAAARPPQAGSPQANPAAGTVPVSVVVSVEAKHGQQVPNILREDVRAYIEKDRVPVTAWMPYQGNQAALDLLLLVDDGVDANIGNQFDALRHFFNEQPATTRIAVAYLRYGMVVLQQNFTSDHVQAGKSLRLPVGAFSETSSPYLAISDFIDHWSNDGNRHEIVLISDGVDELEIGPYPMSVAVAVEHAQAAGVQIYAIYAAGSGHLGHSFWRISWGQNNLAQIADETGGESYGLLPAPPIAYEPFLKEINARLAHQYLLTFGANPAQAGTFHRIHLETEVPNAELVAAEKIYIPKK